jgi:predicted metalloendopeptidase
MPIRVLQADTWIRKDMQFGYAWQVSLFSHSNSQVNAFHLTDLLQVQINTGILQAPLFSNHNLAAGNYGALGMVVGHEITHAFDSIGKKLDMNGVRETWWTETANTQFEENAQCFIDQYSSMQVELSDGTMLDVNGKKTLSENIADNGGLHVAYTAWVQHMQDNGNDIQANLPDYGDGETMTNERLFFVSFAQTWCGIARDEQIEVCSAWCLIIGNGRQGSTCA